MKLDQISKGSKCVPLKTAFILDRMNWYESTDVTLPAVTIANSFMFDFTTELNKLEAYATNSMASLLTTAQILADIFKTTGITYSQISDPESGKRKLTSTMIKEKAAELGISSDVADQIVDDLIKGFGRTISGTGLAAGVVKSILETKSVQTAIQSFRKGDDPNPANWSEIVRCIGLAQQLYGKYCCLEDPAQIQRYIETQVETNPLIKRLALLDSILNRTVGPAMPTKLKNAMRGLLPFFDSEFLYTTKWGLNIYTEEIDHVWWPIQNNPNWLESSSIMKYDDIGYCDLMSMYCKCVMVIKGMEFDTAAKMNVFSLIKEVIHADAEMPLVIPSELQPTHPDAAQALFERVFTEKLIFGILRCNYGAYASRLMNLKDSLRYGKNEQFDLYQKRNIQYLSLVFECFLQTAADIQAYANSPSVMFFDMHPEYLRQARVYFDTCLKRQQPLNLSYDHPRSINDPAQLFSMMGTGIEPVSPNYIWDDQSRHGIRKWLDPETLQGKSFVRTPLLNGLPQDAKVDLPLHLFSDEFADERVPVYCMYAPLPEAIHSYPYFAIALKYWSFDAMADSGFAQYFFNQVELLRPESPDELARELDIPLVLAEELFSLDNATHGKRSIYRYDGPDKTLIWWRPNMLPVFEIGDVPASPSIPQFRALWPFFSYGQSGDKTYKLVKRDGGGIDFATTKYQVLASRNKEVNRDADGSIAEAKPAGSGESGLTTQAEQLNAAEQNPPLIPEPNPAGDRDTEPQKGGKGKSSRKRK